MNLTTLLLQVGVILVTARVVGWLFKRIHQPQVMGEMVAGIMLGPSLLGWLAPNLSAALFPPASLGFLNALSQIGLLLFMFLIGLELDPQILRGRGQTVLVTSTASIAVPFVLGAALALYLYPRFSDGSVNFTDFALFIGTSLSITAFPVLARILAERNLTRSQVGSLAIACAAANDVTGWCILAGVVLLVRASASARPLWVTLLGSGFYVGIMFLGVRRALTKLDAIFQRQGTISRGLLAFILLLVLASAGITEWLGIHALFGAFLVGAIMPKKAAFVQAIAGKLEDLTVVLLLPLFFAFTGLRTSVGLVNGAAMWITCGLIIAVAIAGKFGGSTIAARLSGVPWREATTLGILMNTRGLMELILLNIGLDIGVISPALFTMLVLMALVTTFMTAPILEWVYFGRFYPPPQTAQVEAEALSDLGAGN
jgi:Kef-type K+ transport system membrane component KefB